jgi:hypothetical protein
MNMFSQTTNIEELMREVAMCSVITGHQVSPGIHPEYRQINYIRIADIVEDARKRAADLMLQSFLEKGR